MKRILGLATGMLLLLGVGTSAHATFAPTAIAHWDMAGATGSQASTVGLTEESGITALSMVRGSGLTGNTGANSLNTKGWNGSDEGDYIEFGFSVADGYEVDLSELWIGTKSSATGPGTIGVFTSLDRFANAVYTISQDGTNFKNDIIDLSELGVITGDFFIRLYEIGDTAANGLPTYSGGTFRITDYYNAGTYTDVQLTAYLATVPVPGAVWLLGSGILAAVGLRRKNS